MDDGVGRDIAPDEERLNYIFNGNHNHDLEEDMSMDHEQIPISHSIQSRGNFRIQEPLDTTPDAVGVRHTHIFQEQRPSVANTPDYYKSEEHRLCTFHDWRYQQVVRKEDLARNGFVSTGAGDKVRCIFCNGLLRQWEVGDVVEQEHRRSFPSCPFISGINVGNIPLQPGTTPITTMPPVPSAPPLRSMNGGHDICPEEEGYAVSSQVPVFNRSVSHEHDAIRENAAGKRTYSHTPHTPQMAVEPERLATYAKWPAQMKQKPAVLAQAGLFYTGDGDRVRCFHCDGILYNWDPEDDPFVEHARWFPGCPYILLVKGEQFVEDVKNGRSTQDQVMNSPAVLAVLHEGHSREAVEAALDVLKKKNGPDAVVSAQNLLQTIMGMEEISTHTMNGATAFPQDVNALQSLQRENESLRDKQLCKICMANDVDVIFYPCKHLVCCASCASALQACPICRVNIERLERVFMA